MKLRKKISEMSTGHLLKLSKILRDEKNRVYSENSKIIGGCTSWPMNGDGTPITPESPQLPIDLLEKIDRELFARWEQKHGR